VTVGSVSSLQAEALVTLRVPGRGDLQIAFVVDTGFAGALTLPYGAVVIREL
jgi:predicted aspartyl protease